MSAEMKRGGATDETLSLLSKNDTFYNNTINKDVKGFSDTTDKC